MACLIRFLDILLKVSGKPQIFSQNNRFLCQDSKVGFTTCKKINNYTKAFKRKKLRLRE
jgi:hypothetical protein